MGKMRVPRTKRPRKAPKSAPGLRIQLKGTRNVVDLRAMLFEAVGQIEALGIKYARGVNVYITPVAADGTPLTPVANGQTVKQIVIEEPYRSAADEHGV